MARPNQDNKYLSLLQDYYAEHRLIPSYAAISAGRRLTPTERFFERPRSVASVRAGLQEAVLDNSVEMVSIDSLLVHSPSRTFLVPIKGDSMQDAGLLEGDTVICEQSQRARPGDIVVAVLEGELTIKTLVQEKDSKGLRLVLRPENPNYPILRPDPLEIIGVVTGSFRSYRS